MKNEKPKKLTTKKRTKPKSVNTKENTPYGAMSVETWEWMNE